MLSFFPTIYPDETIYSAWARFHQLLGDISQQNILSLLSGTAKYHQIRFDFARQIDSFSKQLPSDNIYSTSYLTNNHTVFPLHAAFLSKHRAAQLYRAIGYDNIVAGKLTTPRMNSLIKYGYNLPTFARFCPQCAKEDIKDYGEPYWHRLHQIPHINICGVHRCWLKESVLGISLSGKHLYSQSLFSARNIINLGNARSISENTDRKNRKLQIFFSDCAAYFLRPGGQPMFLEDVLAKYRTIFIEEGLMTISGRFFHRRLNKRVKDEIPAEIIQQMRTAFSRSKDSYYDLFSPFQKIIRSPVNHFLIMFLLGRSAHNLMTQTESDGLPFDEGPWPCNNPICAHYKEKAITEVKDFFYRHKYFGKFSCECGFTYIREYGHGNIQAQQDITYSLGTGLDMLISSQSGNVEYKVRRLRRLTGLSKPQLRGFIRVWRKEKREQRTTKRYIKMLEASIRSHPNASRQLIRNSIGAGYDWLYAHDPKQITDRLKKFKAKGRPGGIKHMSVEELRNYDHLHASQLKSTYDKIIVEPGRPRRLSKTRLINSANLKRIFGLYIQDLPVLKKTVNELTESYEKFAKRAVGWHAKSFSNKKKIPTWTIYYHQVGIYNKSEKVLAIIKSGYQEVVRTMKKVI